MEDYRPHNAALITHITKTKQSTLRLLTRAAQVESEIPSVEVVRRSFDE